MIVVSNTSPITNLAAINQLNLLQQLYSHIIIPEAVYQELTNVGTIVNTQTLQDVEFKFKRQYPKTAPKNQSGK